jgi:hypothetical protein
MSTESISRRAAMGVTGAALLMSAAPAAAQPTSMDRRIARRRVVDAFYRWMTQRGSRADLAALLAEFPRLVDFTVAANFDENLFGRDEVVQALTRRRDHGMLAIANSPTDQNTLVLDDHVIFAGERPISSDSTWNYYQPVTFNFLIQADSENTLRIYALSTGEPFTPPFCAAMPPEDRCNLQ